MVKIIINTEQIEYVIARRNKDKKWLASKLHISPALLSHWLKHRKNPSPDNRQKIMNCLRGRGTTWEMIFRRGD
jgi:hypothetical protein